MWHRRRLRWCRTAAPRCALPSFRCTVVGKAVSSDSLASESLDTALPRHLPFLHFGVHIIRRRHIKLLVEVPGKIALRTEADPIGYLVNLVSAFRQQFS